MASPFWFQGLDVILIVKQKLLQVKETKKGAYTDGHERDDVVQDRQERFLPQMSEIMEECVGVRQNEDGTISIVNEDAKWILVSMNQKAHRSNEQTLW